MSVSYWQTEQTYMEANVSPGNVKDLIDALSAMSAECHGYHGNTNDLTWRVEGKGIKITFPGSSSSVGWDLAR